MKLHTGIELFFGLAAAVGVSALPGEYLRTLRHGEHNSIFSLNTDSSSRRSTRRNSKQCARANSGAKGESIPLFPSSPSGGDVPDIPWLGESNQWQAPGPDDVRSPCPFLNTIANHGLIDRSGKDIALFEMAEVVSDTFGLSFDFNNIIAQMAADFGLAAPDEQGVQRINLDALCMHSPRPGVDNNFQEHDSSLFRKDFFLDQENHCDVDSTLLTDVMRANPSSTTISRAELQTFLEQRILHSRTNNPSFFLSEVSVLEIAAQYLTLMLIDSNEDRVTDFVSVDKSRVLEMMLFERLPQGFVPGRISSPENFVPFFPVCMDDGSPLGVRPCTNADSAADVSANLLPDFLNSVVTALEKEVTTCADENATCNADGDCCEGFICTKK